MCAEEAFEPDQPADELAELRRSNAGLYADLRSERGRRHDAEKRAERAEQSLAREQVGTPGVLRRERDEAIRLAQEAYAQLDRLVPPASRSVPDRDESVRFGTNPTAAPEPMPDFAPLRERALAHEVGKLSPAVPTSLDNQTEAIAEGISP